MWHDKYAGIKKKGKHLSVCLYWDQTQDDSLSLMNEWNLAAYNRAHLNSWKILVLTNHTLPLFLHSPLLNVLPLINLTYMYVFICSMSLLESWFYDGPMTCLLYFHAIWTSNWAHFEKEQMLKLALNMRCLRVLLSGRSVHTLLHKRSKHHMGNESTGVIQLNRLSKTYFCY